MKQTSQLIGLSIKDRVATKLRSSSDILSYLFVTVLSGLLSSSVLFASIAPFGIAFVGAAGGDFTAAALLGSVVGYLLAPSLPFRMKYIAAAVIVAAFRWAFFSAGQRKTLLRVHNPEWLLPLLSSAAIAFTGSFVAFSGTNVTYSFILLLCEVLLVGGGSLFFSRSILLLNRGDTRALRQNDLTCVIITFGIITVALCPFDILGLSLGRIIAGVVVLICALRSGEGGGAAAGVTAGVAICLSDYSLAFLGGAFGFGGLMAGVFGSLGRVACAAALVISNGIACALAALVTPVSLAPIIELFISSTIFILLPHSVIAKLSLPLSAKNSVSSESLRSLLLGRLHATSRSLADVSDITLKVSDKLSRLSPPASDVSSQVSERLCKNCSKRLTCWGSMYNDTAAAINELCLELRRGAALSPTMLPDGLLERCESVPALLGATSEVFARQRHREEQFKKSIQLRRVVLDQWSGIEELINGIASDISSVSPVNEELCGRIKEYFNRLNIKLPGLCCYLDQKQRLVIEISVDKLSARLLDRQELCLDLCEMCERQFMLPDPIDEGSCVALKFIEEPSFALTNGVCQVPATQRKLCGDSIKTVLQQAAAGLFILSDGMGTGSLAAVDSSMTASLISRLCSSGVTPSAALRLTNSAMICKSGDETLATVDICQVDLYSGAATFYKAGAAPSFIKKDGRVGFVLSSSLPAGILGSVQFEETRVPLSAGDVVLMVSDGVCSGGEDWVMDELERYSGTDMQLLAERITSLAKIRSSKEHADDITVCAIRLGALKEGAQEQPAMP